MNEKKTAEKATSDMKNEKEVVELERDFWKKKVGELEVELVCANDVVEDSKGALALHFDNGVEHAKVQGLHFNPDANVDELDPFKVLADGKLVDEE